MDNIEQPLPVQTSDVKASGDKPTEKLNQDVNKQDETSKNENTESDKEEEDSVSSASTIVSCIRRRISSSSSEYEDCSPVRKSGGSRRLLRLGQKARARKAQCESGFSTEESDEAGDRDGTSGPQRSTFADYTLFENDDSSSSADNANKSS